MKFRRVFSAVTAASLCVVSVPAIYAYAASVGDKLSVSGGQTQHKGVCDGYSYEVWLDNTGGSGSMTLGKGATFKAEWSASVPSGNFLARRGLDFGSQKKATDYDYIGLDYAADYKQTGSSSGNSRLCVYGWFQNKGASGNVPLVEYYIIEDWVDWCPSSNSAKTVTIDGAQYKIFQLDHTGPTINGGSETFKQYFSVRQDKRTSGHITVSDHFKAWADQGWGIGNLYEVALNAEGWQSSGVADVTMLDVYTDPDKAGVDIPSVTPDPIEPDENGYYFNSTFENGTDDWSGRGAASVKATSGVLSVTGRTDTWNGAAISLDRNTFKAGESYGFSVKAKQDASASEDFKLTLQYSLDGEDHYDEVASGTAAKGEWITLSNPSFKIPSGASGLILYVETVDSKVDFVIDDAIGAVENKIPAGDSSTQNPSTPATPPTDYIVGDLNNDGVVDTFDLILERKALTNLFAGSSYNAAADIDGDGTVAMNDAVLLSKYLMGQISKFPERKAPVTTTAAPVTNPPAVTTVAQPSGSMTDPTAYMQSVRSSFTKNVPANVQSGDNGKTEKVQYYSKAAGANKNLNIWTPPGYDKSKKYKVLYMNHGVFGDESSMLSGFGVREMASNLIQSGDVDPFIIVFPQMYCGPGGGAPGMGGMNMDTMDNYDKFLQDMTDSIMPYVEEHYSILTGKENTAIAGFSMGGRESLYLTISRPDLFGYCCASSPAPGIVPASDMFISNHLGSYKADGTRMKNSDFKIDKSSMPYLIMIGGGTNDSVVGTFPKEYHELFTQNGTDHIWEEFAGGGHDSSVGLPMFYNFFKNLFKA